MRDKAPLGWFMSSRFWLKAESIPMTLEAVSRLNDEQARYYLADMRWGSPETIVCPHCGAIDKHYDIRTQKRWRCKHCASSFSLTSGTVLDNMKIGCRRLLMAMFSFVIGQKGLAALHLRRIIGGQYRTSYTLLHKLREVIMIVQSQMPKLTGTVEMDGGHFSGVPRKGRTKADNTAKKGFPKKYQDQHRTKEKAHEGNQFHPNRRIIMVLRESFGVKGEGASKTVVAVCKSENQADIDALVKKYVEKQSTLRTDELSAYGNVKLMGYTHETVNHSVEFSDPKGVNQNQAESYFSRMRRAAIGIYHRITPKYMVDYASEIAWREDIRRTNTREQFSQLVKSTFRAGVSFDWCNYSVGNKRKTEILFVGT
jgi:transposase-like protein